MLTKFIRSDYFRFLVYDSTLSTKFRIYGVSSWKNARYCPANYVRMPECLLDADPECFR